MNGPLGQNVGKIRSGPSRPSRRRSPDKTEEADVNNAQVGLALAAAPGVPKGAAPPQSILALQKLAGNKAVAQLVGTSTGGGDAARVQRDAPVAAPAPDGAAEVELYPILDHTAQNQTMVTAAEYENERTRLGRLLRYLVHAIPEDAKTVMEDYPFVEVKEMYEEVLDYLKHAGEHYSKGELVPARRFAHMASSYSDIEIKAHKRLMEESAWSYVGKRVGMAVIGFFEGAAEALVGLIDTGAGLVGQHPDLEGKIKKRYDEISQAYSEATGIDSTLTSDRTIGRIGGKVAENLATGKALGGLGKVGTAINAVQAAAAAKTAVTTVVDLRAQGKSWGDILSDPVVLSEFAGAIAGAAGVGASAFPKAKELLDSAGLILNAAQTAALATALAQYQDDPNLSAAQNLEKKENLIVGVLTSAGSTVDMAHSAINGAHPGPGETAADETAGATAAGETTVNSSTLPEPTVTEAQVSEAKATPDDDLAPVSEDTPWAPEAEVSTFDPASAGLRPEVSESLAAVADQLDVVIEVRPVNLESVPHLDHGALSKMELVKAKSITAVDEMIGGPVGRRGLVGLFEPKLPVFPEGTRPEVVAKVQKRYQQRLNEWNELRPHYEEYQAQGLVSIEGGVLEVADPRRAGAPGENRPHGKFKPVAGDVDVFDIRHSDGSPLTPDQRDVVTTMLRSMGIGVEHGAHEWWPEQSPDTFSPEIDTAIRAGHTEGNEGAQQLVAFAPGRPPEQVWAGQTPTGVPRAQDNVTPGGERAFDPLTKMTVVGTKEGGTSGPGNDGMYEDFSDLDDHAAPGGPDRPDGPGGGGPPGPGGTPIPDGARIELLDERINQIAGDARAPELMHRLDEIRGLPAAERGPALDTLDGQVQVLEKFMSIDRPESGASQAEDPLQEGSLPERPAFQPPGPGADIVMIGDSVTGPEAGDPTLARLVEHVRAAEQRFNAVGFTERQTAAIENAPTEGARNGLRAMYYGERIDAFVKETALGDPALDHLGVSEPRQLGPDFFDPATDRWYDLTTVAEWADHVARYGTSGTGTHVPTGR
jgi:hypothetical protein